MKKGAAHIEIVVSFILFVSFVLFILFYVKPYGDGTLSDSISIGVQNSFEKMTLTNITSIFLYANSSKCFAIPLGLGDLNSSVSRLDGSFVESYVLGGNLHISSAGGYFRVVLFPNSLKSSPLIGQVINSVVDSSNDGGGKGITGKVIDEDGNLVPGDISECGVMSIEGAVYNLIKDVSSSGTCFIVTANNVQINGNGHKVTFDTSNIQDAYGIYFPAGDQGSVIRNISILSSATATNAHAIYTPEYLYLTEISNSSISAYRSAVNGGKGIFNANITRNSIVQNSVGKINACGIEATAIDYVSITNNHINYENGICSTTSYDGTYAYNDITASNISFSFNEMRDVTTLQENILNSLVDLRIGFFSNNVINLFNQTIKGYDIGSAYFNMTSKYGETMNLDSFYGTGDYFFDPDGTKPGAVISFSSNKFNVNTGRSGNPAFAIGWDVILKGVSQFSEPVVLKNGNLCLDYFGGEWCNATYYPQPYGPGSYRFLVGVIGNFSIASGSSLPPVVVPPVTPPVIPPTTIPDDSTGCLVLNSANFSTGSYDSQSVISFDKIQALKDKYDSQYETLKEEMGIPSNFNFAIRVGNLSMERPIYQEAQVFAKTVSYRVLYSDGQIRNEEVIFRTW